MLLKLIRRLRRDKKGQGLVEYGLLIAGVALICAAAVSVFGHKTSDMIAAVAAILPGAHTGDNGPIVSGHLIETTAASAAAPIALNVGGIAGEVGQARLGQNINGAGTAGASNGFGGLILESQDGTGQ